MTQAATVMEYRTPTRQQTSRRLVSLDVFRGLVILAMLVVNNLGDGGSTGYFWKHADWPAMTWGQAWRVWWGYRDGSDQWQQRGELIHAYMSRSGYATEHRGLLQRFEATREALNYSLGLGPRGEPLVREFRHGLWDVDQQIQLHRARSEERMIAESPGERIPLFIHCTLADYVMPWFMLIIGVAIPFSVGAAIAKGASGREMWLRTIRRAALLVALGWILCYFRDQFANSLYGRSGWTLTLGMDVLQLLGISYLVARLLYASRAKPRAVIAAMLFVGHWALLRFYPQGDIPRGTFSEHFDAIGFIYDHWNTQNLGRVIISVRGLLSIPPAAATMILGTLLGDRLRSESTRKVNSLMMWGAMMCAIGVAWAFDLPFNKPRWTPSYLLWTSGVGTILLAMLYWIVDVKQHRRWTYPLVVFGTNAIALYFFSILFKVLLLNTPRIHGRPVIEVLLGSLNGVLGPWLGGWAFTVLFIALWWVILEQMHRRRVFLRV